MKNDDSRSYKLRFTVAMGSMSRLSKDTSTGQCPASEIEAFQMDEIQEEDDQQTTLTLEGQGILIYDRTTGEPSHVSSL
jgi:serine/threonine-protein kinase RIM15